jgi:hypothetical protein
MYLFKRKHLYYLAYLDENENREKRISTKCKTKKEALQFLSEFREKRRNKPKAKRCTILEFEKEYLEYVKMNFSRSYHVTVAVSFRLLRKNAGNVQLQKFKSSALNKNN